MNRSPVLRTVLAGTACVSAGTRVARPLRHGPHHTARRSPPPATSPPPLPPPRPAGLHPPSPRLRRPLGHGSGPGMWRRNPRKRKAPPPRGKQIASPGGRWVLRSAETGELRPSVRRGGGPTPPLLPPTPTTPPPHTPRMHAQAAWPPPTASGSPVPANGGTGSSGACGPRLAAAAPPRGLDFLGPVREARTGGIPCVVLRPHRPPAQAAGRPPPSP
jgi:hypothetical protein